jgi:D-sedoheptulose 7-phosphate isomerase
MAPEGGNFMNTKELSTSYLVDLKDLLDRFDHDVFEKIVDLILAAYENEKHIFIMGNGGSGSTASHFACDINKGCCLDLDKKFKMISLSDSIPTMLAYANDLSYDAIFVEQMKNFFKPGDLVIGISGSGNSENVLQAIKYANENNGTTIGLSGYSGGKLSAMVDVSLVADIQDMQKTEDVHMIVIHMIMQAVFRSLHPGATTIAC